MSTITPLYVLVPDEEYRIARLDDMCDMDIGPGAYELEDQNGDFDKAFGSGAIVDSIKTENIDVNELVKDINSDLYRVRGNSVYFMPHAVYEFIKQYIKDIQVRAASLTVDNFHDKEWEFRDFLNNGSAFVIPWGENTQGTYVQTLEHFIVHHLKDNGNKYVIPQIIYVSER